MFEAYIDDEDNDLIDNTWDEFLSPEEKVPFPHFSCQELMRDVPLKDIRYLGRHFFTRGAIHRSFIDVLY